MSNSFTPLDGWYGLVVVNDNGASGSYSLGIGTHTVGVGNGAPVIVAALQAIAPNPARVEAKIFFGLREPGSIGFEILDVAGRLAAEIAPRRWEPGQWSIAWRGRDSRGGRVAPGVYLVRMKVDQRVIALRKLVLLE